MAGGWRKWLIGLLAIAGIGAGVLAWYRIRSPSPLAAVPPEIPAMVVDSDVRKAMTKARDRVFVEPGSCEAWGDLGILFRSHKIIPQANACFAEAFKLEPSNPRWPYLIGTDNLLDFTGDAAPHLRAAYAIATQFDEKSVARLQLAEVLFDQNNPAEATTLFNEELAVAPDNPRAHYGLGVVALSNNDYTAAIAHLTLSANSPYYRQKASIQLVSCHERLGNTAEAEKYARESKLPPNDLPWPDPFESGLSNRQLGQSARQFSVIETSSQGSIEDVLNRLAEIARLHPNDPTQVPRATYLLRLGDYAGAEKACREALAINPDHASGRCFLGISLYCLAVVKSKGGNGEAAKKLFESALAELKRSIELKPDFGIAHLHSGYAAQSLGKQPEAAEEFRMAIQVSPHDPNTHLGLGEVLNAMGKTSEAIPHLEEAARLSPPNDKRAQAILEKIRDKNHN